MEFLNPKDVFVINEKIFFGNFSWIDCERINEMDISEKKAINRH